MKKSKQEILLNKRDSRVKRTEIISISALIISIISGILIPFIIQAKNNRFNEEIAKRQEAFELAQQEKAAIPYLRLVSPQDRSMEIETFEPYRERSFIDCGNGVKIQETYYSIRDFYFENLTDNIAYINHVEYDGEAFELKSINLSVKYGECVNLSSENRFIGAKAERAFYLIIKTPLEKYYSYECVLSSAIKEAEVYYYSVISIGAPKEYNIDNEVYKNMYIHVRGIGGLPPNVIF